MSFSLESIPITATQLADNAAGGYVVFEGRVRNHNEGREVLSLEYEAFDELALAEGNRVVEEALARFAIFGASCVHRIGHLQIGEVAIRVEVAAAHRQEAFEACEWIVDQVKQRVPVWKKEHYSAGESEWINAKPVECSNETSYYSRQTILRELGTEGQLKLKGAKALVIGAGGLGCPSLQYLAAVGIGKITIVDGDKLDETNLHRQSLYAHRDIGQPKAELAQLRLQALNPYIEVETILEPCTPTNVDDLVSAHDVVLDCTDNFAAKFLLNDACLRGRKPLVLASIYQFEGQLMVVQPGGPCLRCLWPEAPAQDCVGSCAEAGVLGVVPGLFGTLQATEAIKLILGLPTPMANGKMMLLDLREMDLQLVSLRRANECPGCGSGSNADSIEVYDHEGGLLVDIREDDEIEAAPVPGAVVMPVSRFRSEDLPAADRYILMCNRGGRSGRLVRQLREAGDTRFFSLVGGASRLRS